VGTAGVVNGVHRVRAQEVAPPTKMAHPDAVELELTLTKLNILSRDAQPLLEKRDALLARYRIPVQDFGRAVSVDSQTGEIKRVQMAAAPPQK